MEPVPMVVPPVLPPVLPLPLVESLLPPVLPLSVSPVVEVEPVVPLVVVMVGSDSVSVPVVGSGISAGSSPLAQPETSRAPMPRERRRCEIPTAALYRPRPRPHKD